MSIARPLARIVCLQLAMLASALSGQTVGGRIEQAPSPLNETSRHNPPPVPVEQIIGKWWLRSTEPNRTYAYVEEVQRFNGQMIVTLELSEPLPGDISKIGVACIARLDNPDAAHPNAGKFHDYANPRNCVPPQANRWIRISMGSIYHEGVSATVPGWFMTYAHDKHVDLYLIAMAGNHGVADRAGVP